MSKKGNDSTNQARFRDGKLKKQAQIGKPHGRDGSVECLGMVFDSEEARRTHFLGELKERLRDPEFRETPGFPQADDETIFRMSDPPAYTACPNPFLDDVLQWWNQERRQSDEGEYHRNPLAVDANEGKGTALYKAHWYHTKVPHQAIIPLILHYTDPGDVVLDGFCGSGLAGAAAHLCGTLPESDRPKYEKKLQQAGSGEITWGPRNVILNDLAPAATFIAAGYNIPFDAEEFELRAEEILTELEGEIGWMYETQHEDGRTGRINYTVWSEVFFCPECSGEIVFLEEAFDKEERSILRKISCPHCTAETTKRGMDRKFVTETDPVLDRAWEKAARVPVIINYDMDGETYEKAPDAQDMETLRRIDQLDFPHQVPSVEFPFDQMWEAPRLRVRGYTHTHHLFTPRAAHALGRLWDKASSIEDQRLRNAMLFFVEQAIWTLSLCNRYRPKGYSQVNQFMVGAYYIPSQNSEPSPWYALWGNRGKLSRLVSTFSPHPASPCRAAITTGDCANLGIPDASIDYIFTDPPFGDNYAYAELNFLVESWHQNFSDLSKDTIVDRSKADKSAQKSLSDYQALITNCFKEYNRVLKPGRWITIVFSNSSNAVWSAIQEAIGAAGLVVADVRMLDKQQGSFKQVTSSAVKQDLVISAYKPSSDLEDSVGLSEASEGSAWEFVRSHLSQVPRFSKQDGEVEVIAERTADMLFDRMVAFHVQRGVRVPLSKSDFLTGLRQRFPERDEMFFLPNQVAEYDRKRQQVEAVTQLQIIVTDEASAIQWLRQELRKKPQTSQDLNPKFLQEQGNWQQHEEAVELRDLLQENFVRYDGEGEVPGPIHSYLSSNYKDLRNLPKDDAQLQDKAESRWYEPNPKKAADLERIRERELLKEFNQLTTVEGRVDTLRTEAARVGFKHLWEQQDYEGIIQVAKKIPTEVVEEDPQLLMYLDQARFRLED